MKKIYFMLTLALVCILGVTVTAEEDGYVPGVNSYKNSITEGAKMVVIYRNLGNNYITGENIYYINQTNDTEGFSNLEMMMKLDAPAGEYTVVVNGGKKATFTISDAEAFVSGATKMKFLGAKMQSENSYSVAYGLSIRSLNNNNPKLTMIIDDKAYTTDMFGEDSIIDWGNVGLTYSENEQGEMEIMFATQIDGVDSDYITTDESGNIIPKFALYFK